MGRKSRAKAARRAERAHLALNQSSVPPPGVSGLPPAEVLARPAVAWAFDAPPLPRRAESDSSTATARLRDLLERQSDLQGEIDAEVRSLLEQGHSWTVVGHAIGLTRQGARQRYMHLITRRPSRMIALDRRGSSAVGCRKVSERAVGKRPDVTGKRVVTRPRRRRPKFSGCTPRLGHFSGT